MTEEDKAKKRSAKKDKKKLRENADEDAASVDTAEFDLSVVVQTEEDDEHKAAERHRKKLLRRAKQQAKLFAELGLDEHGNPLDNFSLLKYPVREWIFTLPCLHDPIALNPVVSLIGVVLLWGLVIWTSANPAYAKETLVDLRKSVTLTSTWIYQGSKSILFFFLMFTAYKYGHIKMGDKRSQPEYSNLSYASMIFVTGVGVGLALFCVPEAMAHQTDNFFASAGYRSQDEKAMFGVNMTVTNWGITAWVHYLLVAIAMSLANYRFGLPMTFRSCFYPILGHYTWGWIGDVIDAFTIVVSLTGICANLGAGCEQISTGLIYLGWVEPDGTQAQITNIQNTVVWIVTVASCASILSGMYGGVRLASLSAVALALTLGCVVCATDDTKFILNLVVQETGYYLQMSLFQLNFWTDAFGQLREGSGRAIDGHAAAEWWMDVWMVLYQAWVLVWAPCIGCFIACISRGRTLGELAVYTFIIPVAASLVWFTAWSAIGLRQDRQGQELQMLGELHYNNSRHFLADGSDLCYDVPQEDVMVDGETIFTNYLQGVTPVCQFDSGTSSSSIFRVFSSFGALGPMLSVIYLAVCVMYFVPSYGAATLVIDGWASNGRKNQHWARRMFWAITIGAMTSVLLSAGGAEAVYAAQATAIVSGLPMAVLLCYLAQTITLFCRAADGQSEPEDEYKFPTQPEFGTPIYGGIFNVVEYMTSLGKPNEVRASLGLHQASSMHVVKFVKGLLIPGFSLHQVLSSTYPENPRTNLASVVCYTASYLSWIILVIASASRDGLNAVAVTAFVISGVILGMIRAGFRARNNIRSNVWGDMVAGIFFWPQVLVQMRLYTLQPVAAATTHEKSRLDTDKDESKSFDV